MNNEEWNLRIIGKGLEESCFDSLEEAIWKSDLHAALDAAHTLKGVQGNLALTSFDQPVSELTETHLIPMEMDDTPYVPENRKQYCLLLNRKERME